MTAKPTRPPGTPAPRKLRFLGAVHEGIPVRNLEIALRFYTEVLDLKPLPRPNFPEAGAWLGDADGTVQFHLIVSEKDSVPGAEARTSPTARHTAWMVQDLDALRERLHALGVPLLERHGNIASDQIFVKDPEGHVWEFQEPK